MAVEPYLVTTVCPTCLGTKSVSEPPGGQVVQCTDCGGTGLQFRAEVDGAEQIADLTDKVNDCLDKLDDILEKLNTP